VADCRARQGVYRGNGTTCANIQCTPPSKGACCVTLPGTAAPICIVATQAICTARGGTYQGDGTVCSGTTCPRPPCACDWNDDGVLTNADLQAFLHDFAAGDADFNNDGTTSNDDLFAFIACFRGGCR
jgi:hypothetical protein